jgi:hypothetical protein
MTARQHHYVPRCYLKGFVANRNKPKLFVVDLKERRSFSTNPINVGAERDFHRIVVDGHRPDALENAFSKFETKLDQALRRIAAARSIGDENDRALLLNLIGLTATKNPRLRENFRMAHEQSTKIIMDLVTATPERWAAHIKRAQEDGAIKSDKKIDYERMRDFVERGEYTVETSTSYHLAMELKVLDHILPLIFNRKWHVFRATPNSSGFVTSDHPMCIMWSDPAKREALYPPGLGLAATQLLFPVSREVAILGAFEADPLEMDANDMLVAQINGSIILHSARQLYARDDQFTYIFRNSDGIRRGHQLVEDLRPHP